ncbi:hypothetical protein L3N51_01239 [Metallosphaera sp. J1]|nr:hypothetical protein [Metallosphaera javensis (ex Hofmann et al. 2022)]BCS92303.1 MAG: hypothetical protein MjAS7_0911 [Metallosphaera javensis (ex Sakai et al. 2022)]
MTKLGLMILAMIFGGTAGIAFFIAYNMIWNTSPIR